jgi:hypothetical protein
VANETWNSGSRERWGIGIDQVAAAFVGARAAVQSLPTDCAPSARGALLLNHSGDQDHWKRQLVLVDVATRVLVGIPPDQAAIDVDYTFMRLCADAPFPGSNGNLIDPSQKLYGLELGHFGGFVRSSWRANDWMWGRLDGAARLVEALLDPTRLREHPLTHVQLWHALTNGLPLNHRDREVLRRSVATLHDSEEIVDPGALESPSSDLRQWQEAWRLRLQLLILREELPLVRRAAQQDEQDHFAFGEADQLASLTSETSTEDMLAAFLASDAGTRLGSTAAAVAISAASSRTTGFPLPLSGLIKTIRGAAQLARFSVHRMTGSPIERTLFVIAMALAGLGLGVGIGTDLGPGQSQSTWKGVLLAISIPVIIVGFAGLWRPTGRRARDRAAATLLAAGCLSALVTLVLALWAAPIKTSETVAEHHAAAFLILLLVALSTIVGWLATAHTALHWMANGALLVLGVAIAASVAIWGRDIDSSSEGGWVADHLTILLAIATVALLVGAWIASRQTTPANTAEP